MKLPGLLVTLGSGGERGLCPGAGAGAVGGSRGKAAAPWFPQPKEQSSSGASSWAQLPDWPVPGRQVGSEAVEAVGSGLGSASAAGWSSMAQAGSAGSS